MTENIFIAGMIAFAILAITCAALWFRHASLVASVQRPWWKKSRWLFAAILMLLIAYPAAMGPIAFAYGRGWIPRGAYEGVALTNLFNPITGEEPRIVLAYLRYLHRWKYSGYQPRLLRRYEERLRWETDPNMRAAILREIEAMRR